MSELEMRRRALNLSERQLARLVGISQSMLRLAEKGNVPPTSPSLRKVAMTLLRLDQEMRRP